MIFDNLIRVLDKSVVISQCCEVCPNCDYVLASVDTYLKFIEATGYNYSCCNNFFMGQQKYFKALEACAIYKNYDTNIDDNYILSSFCKNGFDVCLNRLKDLVGDDNFQQIKEKGIFEQERLYLKNGLCMVLDHLEQNRNQYNLITKDDFNVCFNSILDRGIVIKCISNNFLLISSVESGLKAIEVLYDRVDVSDPSQNELCQNVIVPEP